MPARTTDSIVVTTYRRASDIPAGIISYLKGDPRSNILLPTLQKARSNEAKGYRLQEDEFWIITHTVLPTQNGTQNCIDFVLSCTFGVIGKYPIFIYGTRSIQQLSEGYLESRMSRIIQELVSQVSTRRIYSVFAVDPVASSFARHWTNATGIAVIPEPYYASKFSWCTAATLAAPLDLDHTVKMRQASESEIMQIARLCFGFAAESEPFVLDQQGAIAEATQLVKTGKVWVAVDLHGNVTCIVALTRSNETVTAITKVYTPPEFRKRGYAHRLVHEVCSHLLFEKNKQKVVLYVGLNNPAAKVYHRVGFQGLEPGTEGQYEYVEPWTELGFDRARCDLGHW